MRAKLIFLSLFLFFSQLRGQQYKSIFSDDTVRWHVYECMPDAGGTIVYYSFADSVIDDKEYHIIYSERIYSPEQSLRFDNNIAGFVHEDLDSGKYWFRNATSDDSSDGLFMDLSMEQGDTFALTLYRGGDSIIVDTVYYEDDRKIVQIDKLGYDCLDSDNIKFVEGIGASNGFYLAEDMQLPDSYSLICKFTNDSRIYSTSSNRDNNCFLQPGGSVLSNQLDKFIQIYPNPSTFRVSLEVKDYIGILDYAVYNSIGIEIQNGQISLGLNEILIKSTGIYFVTITDGDIRMTKKLIINGY